MTGMLFRDAVPFLDPACESVACTIQGNKRIVGQFASMLLHAPSELLPHACATLQIHFDLSQLSIGHDEEDASG
jgi:hypothetical protein